MSAICQRVESAVTRWLLRSADPSNGLVSSFALATSAEDVTVTPTGLLVHYTDAPTLVVNFYSGESEEKQELPKVIVSATQGTPEESCPNIQRIPVEVTLSASADSTSTVNSTVWIEQASRWLHGIISGTRGAMDGIEQADENIAVSYVSPCEVGRAPDGRIRVHRWQFDVVASM